MLMQKGIDPNCLKVLSIQYKYSKHFTNNKQHNPVIAREMPTKIQFYFMYLHIYYDFKIFFVVTHLCSHSSFPHYKDTKHP